MAETCRTTQRIQEQQLARTGSATQSVFSVLKWFLSKVLQLNLALLKAMLICETYYCDSIYRFIFALYVSRKRGLLLTCLSWLPVQTDKARMCLPHNLCSVD